MENLWKHFVLREVKSHGLGEKKKKKKIRPVEKNSRTSKKTPPVTAPKESEKSRVSSKLNWKSVLNIVSPSICLCKPDIKRLTVWSRNRVQLRESRNRPKVTRLLNASVHPFSTFLSCPLPSSLLFWPLTGSLLDVVSGAWAAFDSENLGADPKCLGFERLVYSVAHTFTLLVSHK